MSGRLVWWIVGGEVRGAVAGADEGLAVGFGPEVDAGFEGSVGPAGMGFQIVVVAAQGGEVAVAGPPGLGVGADVVQVAGPSAAPAEGEGAGGIAQDDGLPGGGGGRVGVRGIGRGGEVLRVVGVVGLGEVDQPADGDLGVGAGGPFGDLIGEEHPSGLVGGDHVGALQGLVGEVDDQVEGASRGPPGGLVPVQESLGVLGVGQDPDRHRAAHVEGLVFPGLGVLECGGDRGDRLVELGEVEPVAGDGHLGQAVGEGDVLVGVEVDAALGQGGQAVVFGLLGVEGEHGGGQELLGGDQPRGVGEGAVVLVEVGHHVLGLAQAGLGDLAGLPHRHRPGPDPPVETGQAHRKDQGVAQVGPSGGGGHVVRGREGGDGVPADLGDREPLVLLVVAHGGRVGGAVLGQGGVDRGGVGVAASAGAPPLHLAVLTELGVGVGPLHGQLEDRGLTAGHRAVLGADLADQVGGGGRAASRRTGVRRRLRHGPIVARTPVRIQARLPQDLVTNPLTGRDEPVSDWLWWFRGSLALAPQPP